MTDLARSVRAGPGGTARINVQSEVPTGLVWIVSQVSVEAITAQVSVTATLRKNGRYLTSTNQGTSSTAGGLPFIAVKSGESLTAEWSGLVEGDTAILSLYYSEIPWGQLAAQGIQVV